MNIKEYLKDLIAVGGNQSSGRFAFLFSVLLSNVVLWFAWLLACIYARTLVDIPEGVYTAYGLANGVAFLGKGMQSFAERP